MTTGLEFVQDGVRKSLAEELRKQGQRLYPNVGQRTWRVPPIRFNKQDLLTKNEHDATPLDGFKIQKQTQETSRQSNRAEGLVSTAFETLSDQLAERGEAAMFIISNFDYDNYLNKISHDLQLSSDEESPGPESGPQCCTAVVKRPRDVTGRGELDMLVLHQQAGIVLVQTKAVGYCFPSDGDMDPKYIDYIRKAIEKAAEQLVRDRNVMLHVMGDLGLKTRQIRSVIAMPNLTTAVLQWATEHRPKLKTRLVEEFQLDPEYGLLCAEHFSQTTSSGSSPLEDWWSNKLLPRATGVELEVMKDIAFRTVGLLSTVSVWSFVQPRMEVRSLNDAAFETGNRYAEVILSPRQAELLQREEKYFYLWGPAGSGKTLLLSLKGRQWLHKKLPVAILNTRLGSKGRTVGQVMESTINKTKSLKSKAVRIDLDLMEAEGQLLNCIQAKIQPGECVNFLLDEVTWVKETNNLLSLLKTYFPFSAIWCAGMLERCKPEGFDSDCLIDILRCPPSVQRVLHAVDNCPKRKKLYHLDSTSADLPTDGPKPHIIVHSQHAAQSGVDHPYDCYICGQLLADFLLNVLNLQPGSQSNTWPDSQLNLHSDSRLTSHTDSPLNSHTDSQLSSHTDSPVISHTDSQLNILSDSRLTSHTDSHLNSHTDSHLNSHTDSQLNIRSDPQLTSHTDSQPIMRSGLQLSSHKDVQRDSLLADQSSPAQTSVTSPSVGDSAIPGSGCDKTDSSYGQTDPGLDDPRQWGNSKSSDSGCGSDFLDGDKDEVSGSSCCEDSLWSSVQKFSRSDLNMLDQLSASYSEPSQGGELISVQEENLCTLTNTRPVSNGDPTASSAGKTCTDSKRGKRKPRHRRAGKPQNKPAAAASQNSQQVTNPHIQTAKQSVQKPAENPQKKPARRSTNSGGKKGRGGPGGTTDLPHKNSPRLNFRDAVMPVTVPVGWHHKGTRNQWAISRDALAQDMLLLGSGPLCQTLCERGIPLQVEEAMVLNSESRTEQNSQARTEYKNKARKDPNNSAKARHNNFILCPLGAVHGLEYKVVVCVPSARCLPEYNFIYQTIEKGVAGKAQRMKRTQWASDYVHKVSQETEAGQVERDSLRGSEGDIDKVRISTHVSSDEKEAVDLLYVPCPLEEEGGADGLGGSGIEQGAVCPGFSGAGNSQVLPQPPQDHLTGYPRNDDGGCRDRRSVFGCATPPQHWCCDNNIDPENCQQKMDNSIISSNLSGHSTNQELTPRGRKDSGVEFSCSSTCGQCCCFDRSSTGRAGLDVAVGEQWMRSAKLLGTQSPDSGQGCGTQAESPGSPVRDSEEERQSTSSSVFSQVSDGSPSLTPAGQPSPAQTSCQCGQIDCPCCLRQIKAELCGQCDTNKCVCRHFQPHELKALHKLTVWNKAYILMCASRCTSQLVLVLP